MPATMRILSRDAFAAVLGETRALTDRLGAGTRALQVVAAQLAFMAEKTARGRTPSAPERGQTTLGPLAVREFESSDPDYADRLEELDYTFQRYPQLPPGPPIRRRGVLQTWSGPGAFSKLILEPGEPRLIASDGAPLDRPPRPGEHHVFLVWDGVSAHVQARGNHRLGINGTPAWYGELGNHGWLLVGETTLRFFVEDHTPPPKPPPANPPAEAALAELRQHRRAGELYAVIDAARGLRPLQLLEESPDMFASLYDGEAGRSLDAVAPYLVHLREDSQLLDRLVLEGWGEAWGLWLTSRADFTAVRRHLRQFLKIEVEDNPRPVFFRFYDPRVFTSFAPTASPQQRAALLRDCTAILYEDHEGPLRRFEP